MRAWLIGLILPAFAALAFSPAILAQTAPASRGGGSTPNLSGTWIRVPGPNRLTFDSTEPPAMTPWAEALFKANREGVTDPRGFPVDEMDPLTYCMPSGTPRAYLEDNPFEIVQVPGQVYLLFESFHMVRRIYLDGRKMPDGYPPSFMGYSTGKWDGDTLVVETAEISDLSWMDILGTPLSDALRVVERIRRVAPDQLEIEFLFDDSKAFTKPWTAKKTFRLRPDLEIMEHNGYCEDRNRYDFRRKVLLGTEEWKTPGKK